MDFHELNISILNINQLLIRRAKRSINRYLTLRNWLFGYYIQEYTLKGNDRAQYGENLLIRLAAKLQVAGVTGISERSLQIYKKFYQTYPEISQTAAAEVKNYVEKQSIVIPQTLSAELHNLAVVAETNIPHIPGEVLVNNLSFSHIVELLEIEDSLKRRFYETECMRNNWAIRELRRQINSLYYERCGLSKDKKKLAALASQNILIEDSESIIKDPMVFEFLGLKAKDAMDENDLSRALLDRLQEFLLELGRGFCFEARQKRILIGDQYFFIDLVFYHRILKCNVIIELKTNEFSHSHISQLNTYINYYKKNEMQVGDNPPLGILLCTNKNQALVEYALGDVNNKLFVSKYQLELPSRESIKEFVETQLKEELHYLIQPVEEEICNV